LEVTRISRTSAFSIRLKNDLRHKIEEYAELLHLRPSSLCALVLEDKIDEWVKEYANRIYKEVKEK
jgi:hypothetical protein